MRKERIYTLSHRPGWFTIKYNGSARVWVPYDLCSLKQSSLDLPSKAKAESIAQQIILLLRKKEEARQNELDQS
ncbi:MAG: hypothetical protein AAF607_06250, partial [Pseudomonadota bacterium]